MIMSEVSADILIRSVSASDAVVLLDLYQQCEDFLALGPIAEASLDMVLSDLQHSAAEHGNFCGIYLNDRLIGVVDWIPMMPAEAYAFINLLMIAREHRRKGIGYRVLQCIESLILADPAVKGIKTAVQINNEPARYFWNRQGYTVIADPIQNEDETTVVILRKQVSECRTM